MMELRHLRYFMAVATELNFTRAAERLGVAQPPLSRQIRDLELELGVELFDRQARPIRLTQAGRLFHAQAARILASVAQLRQTMESLSGTGRRRFMVGFVGSLIYGAMPEVIRGFRAAAPHLDVHLLELTTLEQVEALKAGRIDAGFGRIRVDDPAVRREVLQAEPLVAAISAGDPLTDSSELMLADLMDRRLIIYPSQPRPSYADQVLALLGDHGLAPRDVEEVRDVQVALGLVASDAGVALVPASLRRVQREDIRYMPIADDGVLSPIILSLRAGDISDEARLFEHLASTIFTSKDGP